MNTKVRSKSNSRFHFHFLFFYLFFYALFKKVLVVFVFNCYCTLCIEMACERDSPCECRSFLVQDPVTNVSDTLENTLVNEVCNQVSADEIRNIFIINNTLIAQSGPQKNIVSII